jgi:hypothetical protein
LRSVRSLAVWLTLIPAVGHPDPATPDLRPEFHFFTTSSWAYNFNHPSSGRNALRVFDLYHNQIVVDQVEAVVTRPAPSSGDYGYRADAVLGSAVASVSAASGLFRDEESGAAEDIDLQQAFVEYVAPLGRGLRTRAGKFVSPMGRESIPGYDGRNAHASNSFLFGYAIPFTHVGVSAAYAFSDAWMINSMVMNGWDAATDNNGAMTGHLGAEFRWGEGSRVVAQGMLGPEKSDDRKDLRGVADAILELTIGARSLVALNTDYGTEENAAPGGGGTAVWRGVALYLQHRASDTITLAVRGEVFEDRDGARTGTAQTLSEGTSTLEVALDSGVFVRGELRLDRSTARVFSGDRRTQATVLVQTGVAL